MQITPKHTGGINGGMNGVDFSFGASGGHWARGLQNGLTTHMETRRHAFWKYVNKYTFCEKGKQIYIL